MIAVIDYDAGNMGSVVKALKFLGAQAEVTRDSAVIERADHVILPGVGAYSDAYAKLKKYELIDTVKNTAKSGKPFLGICLGMQILFDYSEELFEGQEGSGETDENGMPIGLSILPGAIKRIPAGEGLKVPHMGWNSLDVTKGARLFSGIGDKPFVYFVHSYYLEAKNISDVAATTQYGVNIHASVEHENIFGCQFHPEKSGEVGLEILRNFYKI